MPVKTRSMTKAELLKTLVPIKSLTKATNTYKTKSNLRIAIIENNIIMLTFLIIILICVDCVLLCIPENY
jgi:hypothetical protein